MIVPTGLTGIRTATLTGKGADRFELIENGAGSYEIHFAKDDMGNPRATTGNATLKLNVFLEGNNTTKADKVLTVTVKVV